MSEKATILSIADAIVSYLGTGTFGETLAVSRAYVPTVDLADFTGCKVTVVPKDVDMEWVSRSTASSDFQLQIGIQKKLTEIAADELKAEIDVLMLLVESIVNYLWESMRLPDCQAAMLRNAEAETMYSADHLEQLRQFTAVYTVTYRVVE